MAFCSACGASIPDAARFCTKCGTPRTDVAPQPAAAPTPPPPPAPQPAAAATPPPPPPAPQPYAPAPQPAAAPTPPPPPPAPQPYAPAPQPAATGERPIAVIPNASLKTGMMGLKRTNYTLVLTDHRIVFAQITSAMLKQAVADARDSAKAEGKGFFGQWGAQLGAYSGMAQSYLGMAPDQVLAQTPGNFALDRATITSCKLKRGLAGDENTADQPDRLIIKTAGAKYDFNLGSGMGQAKKALVAAALI